MCFVSFQLYVCKLTDKQHCKNERDGCFETSRVSISQNDSFGWFGRLFLYNLVIKRKKRDESKKNLTTVCGWRVEKVCAVFSHSKYFHLKFNDEP